jgi:hypothetical protein
MLKATIKQLYSASKRFRGSDELVVYRLDYPRREAVLACCPSVTTTCCLSLRTNSRLGCPAKYITDLDFADEIMLISDDGENAQKQLDSVTAMARR